MEGKTKKAVLAAVLTVVLLLVAVIGAVIIFRSCGVDLSVATPEEAPVTTYDDYTSDTSDSDVTDKPTENTTPTLPNGEEYTLTQDWDELKAINTDIKGWIHIPNTDINYPVLMSDEDNNDYQYYLHRNFDKSYLFAGSVFIDFRCSDGAYSKNVITHGHNMNNGSMYADLVDYGKYTGNLDVYKKAPVLFFNTEKGVEQWIIFAVYKTNTLERHGNFFNYFVGDFSNDAQFMNYVYNIKERSLFDVPVPVNEDDRIITLSTCSYEYSDFRTVVVARKVRAGENVNAYINNAQLNPDPLWPDVYYTDYNTPKPELTTFRTEYNKDNVSWYDGKGDLEGNEWLPGVKGRSSFTVSFTDCNGEIISTQIVNQGNDATPPPDPQRPDDEYYIYEFAGWQLSYTNVQRDMIIAPSYNPILKEEWR